MSRHTDYRSRPSTRPSSGQLVELHVYVVPPDIWRREFNNFLNQAVTETVSCGIIRVSPDIRLIDLRSELVQQLEDVVPREYVFLKSVGRSITRLKSKQEYQLKAKHFVPPVSFAPELYLLEAPADIQASFASDGGSQSPASSRHGDGSPRTQRGYHSHNSYRNNNYHNRDGYNNYDERYTQTSDDLAAKSRRSRRSSNRTSPLQRYSPLPKINPSSPSRSPEPNLQSLRRNSQNFNSVYPGTVDTFLSNPPPPVKPMYEDVYPIPYQAKQAAAVQKDIPQDTYSVPKPEEMSDPEPILDDNVNQPHPNSSPHTYDHSHTPPPVNEATPHSTERHPASKGPSKYDPRSYTTNTNEDSGIAGLTPDDNYDEVLDRRKKFQQQLDKEKAEREEAEELERQKRLQSLADRDLLDREKWDQNDEERRRRLDEERRRREEEEERNRRMKDYSDDEDDADRKKQGQTLDDKKGRTSLEEEPEYFLRGDFPEKGDHHDNDQKEKPVFESMDDVNRYPSPPQLQTSPTLQRDTESAKQKRKLEKEKLLKELEAAKEERKNAEKEREELVKKAKQLQNKTQNRRNHARDVWKKRYFEEKKKTAPLEDQTNRLRQELDLLHKKLMSSLEGPKQKNVPVGTSRPSQKNNYVIQCTRLQHEIEDLRRRVENAKMKLTAEMKLRNQAEAELRALRAELTQKKINLTLTRSQQLAALTPNPEMQMPQKIAVPAKS